MTKKLIRGAFSIVLLLSAMAAAAQTLQTATVTVREDGTGTVDFMGSILSVTGVLAPDPGLGGLPAALTFSLVTVPVDVTAGDLLLFEPGTSMLSDVIRFNPAGTGDLSYPASLVFYSDLGVDELADTGFPLAFYTNIVASFEVGTEGSNGFIYTPSLGQPGFVEGFAVVYNIISDSPAVVPEPETLMLMVLGLVSVALTTRRRRQKSPGICCA